MEHLGVRVPNGDDRTVLGPDSRQESAVNLAALSRSRSCSVSARSSMTKPPWPEQEKKNAPCRLVR